jgi:hypothetical protein
MKYIFRPLPVWPYPTTPPTERRSRWTFKASWSDTLQLLEHEISGLSGHDVVIGAGFRERDVRLDGMPRADAQAPQHPGIEISFDTGRGRLTYSTDVCTFWQHNVRSIALGLEALRAVDRYGITHRGEQYAGFLALAAGGPDSTRGAQLVEQAGGVRQALMASHPDHGGDPTDFADVQAYREKVGDR